MSAISYDLTGAAEASGMSVRSLQVAISEGRLPVHYAGRKPLVLATDLAAFVAALPTERAS